MKKRTMGLLMMTVIIAAIVICGCSTSNNDGESHTMSMIIWADSYSSSSANQNLLIGFGCSDSDISGIGTKSVVIPEGTQLTMSAITGSYTAQNYYVGNSTANLGPIDDPHYDTAQRQYSTGNYTQATYLNGIYNGAMGDKAKNFTFNQSNFLSHLSATDVTTGTGGTSFDVVNGDTITVSNQNDSSLRYYCVIYNSFVDTYNVQNLWSSADIRKIDYVDTDAYANFLANDTVAPVNGTVTFTVPGGILDAGTDNLRVVVYAVNTSTLNSDTTGEFRTLVVAFKELVLSYTGQ